MQEDDITAVFLGDVATYDSMEDFRNANNVNILYPTTLPADITLTSIQQRKYENEQMIYLFIFNSSDIVLTVRNYFTFDATSHTDLTVHKTDVCEFYIKYLETGTWQAVAQYNGFEYTVSCSDYDTLILMLDSMKGFES